MLKTKRDPRKLFRLTATVFIFLSLTTCRPMLLQDTIGYVPVSSQTVSADGGTVTDARGASVVIPEGALAGDTTITIAAYEGPGDIYSRHGVTPFTGGADFGPDGTAFLKAVTITLPSAHKLIPGQEQSLFMYNPDTDAWEQTEYTLTSDAGGYSATAEVTHFTPYVASFLPPGSLSMFEEFFDGTNGEVALGSYMAWFLTVTNLYGYTTDCGNSTYEVAGIHFSVNFQVDGTPGSAASLYGEAASGATSQLNYTYDYTSFAGKEINYDLLVTVHFEVTENPEPSEATIAILEPVPGKTVSGIETIYTYMITGDDEADVTTVNFYLDGVLLGNDTEAPFLWHWDTDGAADGEHTLTATAELSTGKSITSEGVTVRKGEEETYSVTINQSGAASGESVISNVSTASEGATVTLTASLGSGRQVDLSAANVTISPSTINTHGGTATFTMPASDVTITATFSFNTVTVITHTANSVSFDMHYVPSGGPFTMGEHVESSTQSVTLTNNFWMGETEVTQGLWEDVWEGWPETDPATDPDYGVGDNYPAYYMNWYDAAAFCNLLTLADDSITDTEQVYYSDELLTAAYSKANAANGDEVYANWSKTGFRLPTEAEWEYTARYIDGTSWNCGDHASGDTEYACYIPSSGPTSGSPLATDERISEYAWWSRNNSGTFGDPTYGSKEVRQKTANALGLRDMSGNVFEFCFDLYSASGSDRTLRGGSWNYSGSSLRCARRRACNPADRQAEACGFRLCRTAD